MLVSSFNLSQSFNYIPYLFSKKLFKSQIILTVYGPCVKYCSVGASPLFPLARNQ
jgi:hypothetical protein